jgi:hypothetical protein
LSSSVGLFRSPIVYTSTGRVLRFSLRITECVISNADDNVHFSYRVPIEMSLTSAVAALVSSDPKRSVTDATTTRTQRHPSERNLNNDDDSCPESWVELAPPSRGSLSSSVDVMLANDVDKTDKDSRMSPVSVRSPHVEMESSLEQVKFRLIKDMLPPGKNSDWIWDWSSRPEVMPPKGLRFRPNAGSVVTTPPNSPIPEMPGASSFRHSKLIRSAFFRIEVLVGLVVSNLVTFVLGAAIGFCICKRLYDGDRADP